MNKKTPFFLKKGGKVRGLENIFKGPSMSRKHGVEDPFIN